VVVISDQFFVVQLRMANLKLSKEKLWLRQKAEIDQLGTGM
jgi:hypothetical protein